MSANPSSADTVRAIEWTGDRLRLLDQRLLPDQEKYLTLATAEEVAEAIRNMVVRGAPAIGIAAAYGMVLAAQRVTQKPGDWRAALAAAAMTLADARPTAVNLRWALERMEACADAAPGDPVSALCAEAQGIHAEDVAANKRMGEAGAALISAPAGILTYCNTGSLATGGYGTALGVIRSAWVGGKLARVFACETRPWLQGSRLTAWELVRDGIPVTLLADTAAGHLMQGGNVQWLVVGADRVAANGDVANKIGTYTLALAARYHGIPLMVVAPTSTLDPRMPTGENIPIEEREPGEILTVAGRRIAAPGAQGWNPAFDITPVNLVDVLVTERGVLRPPSAAGISGLLAGDRR